MIGQQRYSNFQNVDQLINPINAKTLSCPRHKKQKITHICVQSKCQNNPLLCAVCFNENINRSYHYQHDKNIFPVQQAIDKFCGIIKTQINPMNKIFRGTIGRSQYVGILNRIQKSNTLYSINGQKDSLAERISNIKSQIQLELQLLTKQFQKVIIIEKQQYFKVLDNYQKVYIKNLQYIRTYTQLLLQYENSVKYFSNNNNFQVKMMAETMKKSDWLIKIKKSIHSATKNLENTSYSSQINNILYTANKAKIDMWPMWKGQQNSEKSTSMDLKYLIKRTLSQWAHVPDTKTIQEEIQSQSPGSGISVGSKGLIGLGSNSSLTKNYFTSGLGK